MASSGWQGFVTLQSGGFGYSYFKGNLRINSISHSGNTVTVNADFGVKNDGGQNSYYYYPINARVRDITNYQQVVAGQDWINTNDWRTSGVNFSFSASSGSTSADITVDWLYNNSTASNSITYTLYFDASYSDPAAPSVSVSEIYDTSVKFNVSTSSYGVPSSASGRWIEAGLAGQNAWTSPYLRSAVALNTSSATITVNNSSTQTSTLTIAPNTQYWYGGYTNNTVGGKGAIRGQLVTKASVPTMIITKAGSEYLQIDWSEVADGGYYNKTLEYTLDGNTWTTLGTYSGGSAQSGNIIVTDLVPNTAYPLQTRSTTTVGTLTSSTTTVYTLSAEPTITQTGKTLDSITMQYSFPADGGASNKTLTYSIDGGVTWVQAATITTGSATTGTFTISGLEPAHTYNLITKVTTTGGTITLDDITIYTLANHRKFYGSAQEATGYSFSYSNLTDTNNIIGEGN